MDLSELRNQIDELDREIIARINRRIQLAAEIGQIKRHHGAEIYVPSREEEVFDRLKASNTGPLDEAAIRAIYREIISVSISMEQELTIAFLGPETTYNHQAALKNFGQHCRYQPVATIPDVFAAVERSEAHYGVIPVENSSAGAVYHSYDRLVDSELKVIAQVLLPIDHCLISHSGYKAVAEVHSHPQALAQCRDWLRRNLPQASTVETSSTARAVQIAAERPEVAAIAGQLAAETFRVPIQAKGIQDKAENITRFLVLGRTCSPALGQGRDRTSFVFSIHDELGALQRLLEPFSRRGLNLTKIESRPSRRKAWDYYFFIDVNGHIDEEPVKQAFEELKPFCPLAKWLGSYPNVAL